MLRVGYMMQVLSICHTVVVEKDPALSNSTAPSAAGMRTAKVRCLLLSHSGPLALLTS